MYCSITGFGQTGPYRHRAGYDPIFQAMGGLMSVNGERDGRPGAGPMRVGVPSSTSPPGCTPPRPSWLRCTSDRVSGEGQFIDAALLDVETAMMSHLHLNWFVSGQVPQRWGNDNPTLAPYEVLACQGGHIILAVANDSQFKSFAQAVGRPEWAEDPRFKVGSARGAHRDLLCGMVGELMLTRTMHEWIELLESNNVPCGPINNIDQVFEDPQVQHRGMRVPMAHPSGPISLLASPMRFGSTPVRYELPPPLLGEHTAAVLQQVLGLGEEALRARCASSASYEAAPAGAAASSRPLPGCCACPRRYARRRRTNRFASPSWSAMRPRRAKSKGCCKVCASTASSRDAT